ncbi:MAG: carbamoyltransferase C-terminal domain-containing protein [Saprospiraceae bacterium]|nr:carbamoyltransferase [Saprospiraceae bacterium]MDW8230678.1 carbamoyltransferase C-terminal domain-containing protein [Saprospiraceae bacterium]
MNSATAPDYTLGLNVYHADAAAALFRGNELLVASEEERFRRVKHWAGLPTEAIRFCLQEAGIELGQVRTVAVSRNPFARLGHKIAYVLRRQLWTRQLANRAANAQSVLGIKGQLAQHFGLAPAHWAARVRWIEHHRSHLASAFWASPFHKAALLSIDGMGDFTSSMTAIGDGNTLRPLQSVLYPHSLGFFYTAFTQLLGFPHYGDEYKVMGLAPYGKPLFLEKMRSVIRLMPNGKFTLHPPYFRHFWEGVEMSWEGQPTLGHLYTDLLAREFGPARQPQEALTEYHCDLAASVQAITEEIIFHVVNHLHQRTGLETLCVAGGVAQNSVAMGKLRERTPFRRVFLPPAGHDAGTSIGAALYTLHAIERRPRPAFRYQAYTGYQASVAEIEEALRQSHLTWMQLPDAALFERVAECLIQGGIVGWYQGRAEFGPRALGNRSILADPRHADARERINEKIKRRENFRPFAPAVLAEAAADFFENADDVPYMEKVYPVRPEKRPIVPAVTHVDGTGRLQTVRYEDNPRFYRLIETFARHTGVPVLLNTSFNENEPIVNRPEEAIACFLRTRMDMLVLENYVIERSKLPQEAT